MIKKLLSSVFFFLFVFVFASLSPKPIFAQGADVACIGKDLATYMNSVIDGAGGLSNIRLLSPVFSASNPDSVGIAKQMTANGANFGALAGIGVNAYNGAGKTITQWSDEFLSAAGLSGQVLLTEIGNNTETTDINVLIGEAAKIKSSGKYIAGLLFNALNSNSGWTQFALNESQIKAVCGGSCDKIGVNFATFYGETGQSYYQAANGYGMKYTLEIARNDSGSVAQQINSLPAGITPVIRIGVEADSGGFSNPADYVNFLKEVNSKVNRVVYAVAGPNEPGYESWASPECKMSQGAQTTQQVTTSQVPIPEPIVSCGETRGNEFHSLRPYQASPCGMIARYVEEDTLFCGNDIVVKQNLNLLPSGGDIEPISCEYRDNGSASCTFQVENTANIEVDLKESDLPIVGNTQLVPNEINKVSVLDEATRLNNYVSWFLNGTVFVAEENPITNTVKDIDRLINFSGPIKKLLPASALYSHRANQTGQAGSTRHNQIYECLLFGNPVACTSSVVGLEARLRPDGTNHVGGQDDKALRLSQYQPLTSTEDRPGEVVLPEPQVLNETTKPTQPNIQGVVVEQIDFTPNSNITNVNKLIAAGAQTNPSVIDGSITPARDDLYFAHMKETTDLAEMLQNTFVSVNSSKFTGDTGMDAPYFNTTSYTARCELADAKTNPGDDLFGDYNNDEKGYNTNITGKVHYKTNIFTVDFNPPSAEVIPGCVEACGSNQACVDACTQFSYKPVQRNVYAAMSVYTKTPKLNELAERTMSVVKKIFPFDIITQVVEKKDYAAYTNATYKQPIGSQKEGIEILAGDPEIGRSGESARIYFPHLGSIEEYFLKGIQCALRPQGMCESADVTQVASAKGTIPRTCYAPQPKSVELDTFLEESKTEGQAAKAVPKELLEAIYWIEGWVYYQGNTTGNYECVKNPAGALGLMQVTNGAYEWIVPPSQRAIGLEEEVCTAIEGKQNRCNPVDEMNIAAGVLLVKVGKWDFKNFKPTGSISLNNVNEVYKAAAYYYGTAYPDNLGITANFAKDNIPEHYWRGGSYTNMGYGDLVYYYIYCQGGSASSCKYPSRANLQ